MIKNIQKIKKKKNSLLVQSGYAILELIFYISLFIVVSFIVIDAMIIMARSFKETSVYAELTHSGTIIERMSREIRQAYDVDMTSTSTDLKLNIKDVDDIEKTVEFLLSGSNIQLLENGVFTGNLNAPNINITALNFTQINTVKGKAVKVSLSLESDNDTANRIIDFYDTIVLRNSY